jgi:hypothetical protein
VGPDFVAVVTQKEARNSALAGVRCGLQKPAHRIRAIGLRCLRRGARKRVTIFFRTERLPHRPARYLVADVPRQIKFTTDLYWRRGHTGMSTISGDSYREAWLVTGLSRASRVVTTPAVICGSLALIYAMTLTANYFWDGITFALCIEKVAIGKAGADRLFHQNHLLYNAIGFVLYRGARAAGLSVRALTVLQLANVGFGSFAIALYFQIAERVTRNRYAAALSSIALGLSAVWWKLSTDADAYILAVLLILLCLKNLLGPTPRWYIAGLSLAGAMLIHELASLFFLAAILAIFLSKDIPQKLRFACGMGGFAWSITIGVYYVCAATLHGMTDPLEVVRWAVSNPSRSVLSLNPIHGIVTTPRKNIDAIIGHDFALFRSRPNVFSSIVASATIIALLALAFSAVRTIDFFRLAHSVRPAAPLKERWKDSVPALIAWIIPYVVFLLFFEPEDFYYPLFYMPALALLFGLVLSNYHLSTAPSNGTNPSSDNPSGIAALAVLMLAVFNLIFFIVPNMQQDSNPLVTAAKEAREVWNEHTVIYFANHNEADTTFEYFNNRTVWRRVSKAPLAEIENQIESASGEGGSVWLNRGAIELIDPEWLARYACCKRITVDVPGGAAQYVELSLDR